MRMQHYDSGGPSDVVLICQPYPRRRMLRGHPQVGQLRSMWYSDLLADADFRAAGDLLPFSRLPGKPPRAPACRLSL